MSNAEPRHTYMMIYARYEKATKRPVAVDQAEVERFKILHPGRRCDRFGVSYMTPDACKARLKHRFNESDIVYEVRTAFCRDCMEAK